MSRYEIRLGGQLDSRWSEWFEGLTLITDSDGCTTLTGPVIDQAALHGLIRRVNDLGVPLISVSILHDDAPASDATHLSREENRT
ncbi:hypothetical protein E3T28_03830 [Cryobacterium sinapicolor]|uniref:Uncharacterized protein n=1 Tax=Cryobacterium sinapicolor TaxID=1259236 RepID=A0ABY2JDI9_9MICO|nr:hypothetical protein E3O67_10095 [Cryobacterium sp. TMT3-29-2]TFD03216.1 hypothetical protein E3T28_03830 [Cryobacterium sinapicolor]